MAVLGNNYFGITDYIVLGATLLISMVIGLYHGYKGKQTTERLLMGDRNMGILPVAASVMATYASAISIIGIPSEVYAHGAQVILLQAVTAFGIPVSAFLFVPFFYKMKLTSVNEYLERRFDSKWVRWLASSLFIFQQVVLAGVTLYAPSLALEAFLGFPVWVSVFGIGICATIYTNIGGLKAVVWTDAFQYTLMVGGLVAIVAKGIYATGGFGPALSLAKERGRMHLFDFTFDPFMRHNFWNFVIGIGFHSMMQPGIHQLQVQRYSGMPTVAKAQQVILGSIPLKLLYYCLCLIVGWALFAFYANCDPVAKGDIKKIDQILPYFVVNEMANIPGMLGIFTSCVFSAVLSTISSSLNSLTAVTWEDFLSRHDTFRSMSPRSQTNVSRIIGVIYGLICIALAFASQNLGAMYAASYAVTGPTHGALYSLFLMAVFLPFVNSTGAIAGALSGLVTVWGIAITSFFYKNTNRVSLPVSTEACPAFNFMMTTTPPPPIHSGPPLRLFSLSYLLYHITAASVSITVAIFVSLLIKSKGKPRAKDIHPLVRKLFRRFCKKENSEEQKAMPLNYFNAKESQLI